MLLKKILEKKREALKRSSYEDHVKKFIEELKELCPELLADGVTRLSVSVFNDYLQAGGVIKNRISQSKYMEIVRLFVDMGVPIVETGRDKTRYYINLEEFYERFCGGE